MHTVETHIVKPLIKCINEIFILGSIFECHNILTQSRIVLEIPTTDYYVLSCCSFKMDLCKRSTQTVKSIKQVELILSGITLCNMQVKALDLIHHLKRPRYS